MELPKGFSLNPLLRASYVIDPADHAAGIADRDAVFRNILCDDASRSDHAPSSNSYARQKQPSPIVTGSAYVLQKYSPLSGSQSGVRRSFSSTGCVAA